MPVSENVAVVAAVAALAKVTLPGPLIFVHDTVSDDPAGNPSSVAVPANDAALGWDTVRSGPALTTGAWLAGGAAATLTWTWSFVLSAPSLAVNRST